jgi:predicted RNase H-like nuclease (RuvC/YqgF family)
VKIGDTLFVFEEDNDDESENNTTFINQNEKAANNWKEKEYIEVNKEIQIKKNELNFMTKKLIRLKNDEDKVKNEVMIDALPKVEYHRLKNSINDLDQEIQLVQKEIDILLNKLQMIRNVKLTSNKTGVSIFGSDGYSSNSPKVFISPIEGYISRILKENYEVTLRSEVVMHLYQPKGVIVKAFFQQKDYNQIKKGDVVEVEFPDGKVTKGIISMVLYETNRLPEEFQKKFEPTTRVINADIVPFDKEDLKLWKKYNKLSVIVRKEKY